MRVTRESLVRIARQTAVDRAKADPTILAAYLTGSLASGEEPMLGGCTDVDIVFVHSVQLDNPREIVRLTPEFHLDIVHRAKADYKSPRELRTDPRLAWELYDPMLLFQSERFFEFYQAGLRAGFEFSAPALVIARCRALYAESRRAWTALLTADEQAITPRDVLRFLSGVESACNAVVGITAAPLAERSFLPKFAALAEAGGCAESSGVPFQLLGAGHVDAGTITAWLPEWEHDFASGGSVAGADARIDRCRYVYYSKAILSDIDGGAPAAALWPLMMTWTLAASRLPAASQTGWRQACTYLGLVGPSSAERLDQLDLFLDAVDSRLEQIATENGIPSADSP